MSKVKGKKRKLYKKMGERGSSGRMWSAEEKLSKVFELAFQNHVIIRFIPGTNHSLRILLFVIEGH